MKGIVKFIQRALKWGAEASRKVSVISRYVTKMSSAKLRESKKERSV
jgi:hypothetical protein